MSKAKMGPKVAYCGHDGYFLADIYVVGNTNVIRATGKVSPDTIVRPADGATHHLTDFPKAGFWRADLGVFVVPEEQVRELEKKPCKHKFAQDSVGGKRVHGKECMICGAPNPLSKKS